MDNIQRLQKFLSQCGVASRRSSEEYILQGRVKVNGKVVTELGTKVDIKKDKVAVDNKIIAGQENKIFAFHKPTKVLTTMSDPRHRPSVGDYARKLPVKIFPIGRLDFDAAGLLLLTNDGEYANKLLHPRYKMPRSYWVVLDDFIDDDKIMKLLKGVKLEDGFGKADFLKRIPKNSVQKFLKKIPDTSCVVNIIVSEGRNHFVKRLFESIDLTVQQLFRHSYGKHKIGTLKSGEIREVRFL